MIMKFHVNPETGNPGICTATNGKCPYKDENGNEVQHYDNPNDARISYEKSYATPFDKPNKNNKIKNLFPNGTDRKIAGKKYWDIQDAAENIYKNLTDKQRAAVDYYNSYRYYDLNEALWNNDDLNSPATDDNTFTSKKEVIEELDSIIRQSKFDTPQIVYRGIKNYKLSGNKEQAYNNTYEVGSVFTSPGYMSSTYDLDTANQFAGNNGVIFEILTTEGYNKGTTEVEVLLGRDQQWRVIGSDTFNNEYGIEKTVIQIINDKDYQKL